MDVIEKVARALCLKEGCNPDDEDDELLDGTILHWWRAWIPEAKAAIEAIEEFNKENSQ